jgi:thiol-disulfide isomerase/thioredoxin
MQALVLFVAIGLCLGPAAADDRLAMLKIGRVAPGTMAAPFNLKALDGSSVELAHLKGKVVVLNFWATWCGPCKEEMPAFERLRQQLDPERFALLTITTDLQREGIRHFLASLHVRLPVLFDEDQAVSQAYLVRALPTTMFIDQRGMLIGRAVGPRDWDAPNAVQALQSLVP